LFFQEWNSHFVYENYSVLTSFGEAQIGVYVFMHEVALFIAGKHYCCWNKLIDLL
jgi:hypothetical protein